VNSIASGRGMLRIWGIRLLGCDLMHPETTALGKRGVPMKLCGTE
jgi:hypothetical protein